MQSLFLEVLQPRFKTAFVCIYSTFLQRALDSLIHDIALQNLPVRFILDRAGFVGADGATHHGIFDLSYLRMIPNMVIMTPKDAKDFDGFGDFFSWQRANTPSPKPP